MKKLLILTLIFLVGCAPTSTPTTNPSISEPTISVPDIETEKDLFISEIYASDSSTWGRAIEIGNLADEAKCLEGYKINIYSGKNLTKSIEFSSNDYIDKHGTFVIANKENNVYNYHAKSNMILDDNYIFGSNVIEFEQIGVGVFDKIGSVYKYGYAEYSSHLKLPSFYGPSLEEYDVLKYINVRVDESYSYLGNLDCPFNSQEEILEGPRITEEMYEQPYEIGSAPGGGFIEATVSSYGDGDTTVFRFNGSYVNIDNSERTRYMNINTPEISHSIDGSGAEPWGYAAKTYNNNVLKGATKILVQSVKGYGFRETYGRLLGYVWYTTKSNPQLSDYRLLNLEMVREGYAYYGESGPLKELYSNDIYYTTYFNYVYLYAQKSGIRIHGEKDPNFDY